MSQLPEFRSYGDYSNDNYGAHSLVFTDTQGNDFYFSYKTCVAFSTIKTGLVCSENVWSVTTGKHLNWIQPDKKERVSNDVFEQMLKELSWRDLISRNQS